MRTYNYGAIISGLRHTGRAIIRNGGSPEDAARACKQIVDEFHPGCIDVTGDRSAAQIRREMSVLAECLPSTWGGRVGRARTNGVWGRTPNAPEPYSFAD